MSIEEINNLVIFLLKIKIQWNNFHGDIRSIIG